MSEKDIETRKNIIEYCEANEINDRDMFYLLHAFHVDNKNDFQNMIDYIRRENNHLPVSKVEKTDEPTKIYTLHINNEQPKKD